MSDDADACSVVVDEVVRRLVPGDDGEVYSGRRDDGLRQAQAIPDTAWARADADGDRARPGLGEHPQVVRLALGEDRGDPVQRPQALLAGALARGRAKPRGVRLSAVRRRTARCR